MDLTKVDAIIENYDGDATSLLAIMQDVQDQENYLPREAVNHISAKLDVPISRIYSMATFFESFHLEPRGKHICSVCLGTACHVNGAPNVLDEMERQLGIKSGDTLEIEVIAGSAPITGKKTLAYDADKIRFTIRWGGEHVGS